MTTTTTLPPVPHFAHPPANVALRYRSTGDLAANDPEGYAQMMFDLTFDPYYPAAEPYSPRELAELAELGRRLVGLDD